MSDADHDPSMPVRLGTLEQQVMDALWDHGPLTIREVINRLDGDPAYTTIATVLANLQRKGLVTPRREGRTVRFEAQHSREEHVARVMGHALSASHDRVASILYFIDTLDSADAKMLRDYLAENGGGE